MWKELLIFSLILLYLLNYSFKTSLSANIFLLDIVIIFYVLLGIIYLIISNNRIIALWSFRSLFEIFLFYLFGRICAYNINDFDKLFKILFFAAILTSIFAVIQVEVIGADFFYKVYGFDELAVAFTAYDYSKIRASSTFITPHEFGLFIVINFVLIYYLLHVIKPKSRKLYYLLGMIILLAGLSYAFSRSSFVILVILACVVSLRSKKYFIIAVVLMIFSLLAMYLLGALGNLESILSSKDPSSMGRINVLSNAVKFYQSNPFGSGLGTAGVVVRRFNPEAPQFEGEMFNIIAQMGPFGLIFHLFIYGYILWFSFRIYQKRIISEKNKLLSLVIFLVALALMLRDLILPRDFTNYMIGWFLIGAYISYIGFINVKVRVSSIVKPSLKE